MNRIRFGWVLACVCVWVLEGHAVIAEASPLEKECLSTEQSVALAPEPLERFCTLALKSNQVYEITLGWETGALAGLSVAISDEGNERVVRVDCSNAVVLPSCSTTGDYEKMAWGSVSWSGGEAVAFLFKSEGSWSFKALAGPLILGSDGCPQDSCSGVASVRTGTVMARIGERPCDPFCS